MDDIVECRGVGLGIGDGGFIRVYLVVVIRYYIVDFFEVVFDEDGCVVLKSRW